MIRRDTNQSPWYHTQPEGWEPGEAKLSKLKKINSEFMLKVPGAIKSQSNNDPV